MPHSVTKKGHSAMSDPLGMPMSKIPKKPVGKLDHEGHRQRLRERFLRTRLNGFQEYEILELLLTFSIPRRDVKTIAREAIRHFGSLAALLDAGGSELLDVPGLGPNSVVLVKLMRDLADYYLEQPLRNCDVLENRNAVMRYLRSKLGGGAKETLLVLFLGSRNRLLDRRIYPGTVDRSALYIREVVEHAVLCHATGVVIAHNHPSGLCMPSPEDREFTRALEEALESLGLALYDHLIVTHSAVNSLLHDGE